jgi:capsular polysaccharide biosynthesis protein
VDDRERKPLPLRAVLVRGLPLAVICAAACAVVAGMLSARRESVYTTNALVLMQTNDDPAADPSSAPQPEGQGVATKSLLVTRRPVLERAAKRLDGVTVGQLDGAVSVSQVAKTDAVRVTAETNDPKQAAAMANGVAEAFVAVQRRDTRRRAAEAVTVLRHQFQDLDREQRQGAPGVALRERMQDLVVLQDVGSTAPQVAEKAQPPADRSSPDPKRDAIFGGIFGFILGIGIAVLWVASDRRMRDPDEVADALGAPALVTMPRRRLFGGDRARQREEQQAWQLLHLGLRANGDGPPPRTVAVTTLNGRSGRSRVAYGLAATAAASGRHALLISMDPDRDALNGTDVSGDRLDALLAGDAQLPEVAETVEVAARPPGHFDVLAGSIANGTPSEPVDASRLGDALSAAAATYELVIVDTPSVLERVESLPIVSEADATVVVVPPHADREQVAALRSRLDALRAHVTGVVLGRG